MSFQVKIWGARGSLPAPIAPDVLHRRTENLFRDFFAEGFTQESDIPKFLQLMPPYRFGGYGGNTPCVEICTPKQNFFIDGGSGIRTPGYELLRGPCGKGTGEVHLFFTHFHWDHLIGLPFFTPLFIPGNQIHVYSVQPELEEVFKTLFKKPYFPVSLDQLGSKIHYHQLEPRKAFQLNDVTLTPFQLDHPDPCWGYRVEWGGKVYSHCVDTEATRVSRAQLGADLPLYQGVDLMVFDAQYTILESIEKVHWGHASASVGLEIAMREGVKKVLFMHHDPAATDEKIAAAERQARQFYENRLKSAQQSKEILHPLEWSFAREGMLIEV